MNSIRDANGPNLALARVPQPRLAEHGRDETGRVALLAQVGDDLHDVGLRVPLGQAVEQPQPLGREQLDELGAIHPATLALGRHEHAEGLALTLHECQIANRLALALSL